MIGETPGNGSTGSTLTQDYENAYLNGWQGVMPWTSNGVDGNGGFAQLQPATNTFRNNHPSLVFPGGGTGPTNTPTRTNTPSVPTNTPTRTNTPNSFTPTRTNTPNSFTPTRTNTPNSFTPTRTNTPAVLTATPTQPSGGTCTPVTSTISIPFSFDGAGVFCWQAASLGSYINSWNTISVNVNGTNVTNVWVGSGSYPAKINNNYYVAYNSNVAWGHFEAK
jgi:hypothetical protein